MLNFYSRLLIPIFIIIYLSRADLNSATYSFVLRDILPFFYFLLIPGLVGVLRLVPEARIINAFRLGCLWHLIWYLPSSLGLLPSIYLPWLSDIPIFSERSDISGVVMGMGILFWSSFPKIGLKANTTLSVLFFVASLLGRSRAGLFATISCLAFLLLKVYIEGKNTTDSRDKRTLTTLAVFTVTGFLGILLIGQSISSENAMARLGVFGGETNSVYSAQNTGNARLLAARAVFDWTIKNNSELFGEGPGAQIVLNSGAVRFLSGNLDVRAPHNWWVHLFARYGLVGLFFWCTILGAFTIGKHSSNTALVVVSIGSIFAILVSSTFGVILESPFGSIPLMFLIAVVLKTRDS